jgi:KipI family sensor histidine kinase inhibitor
MAAEPVRVLPAGDRAVLLELRSLDEVLRLFQAVEGRRLAGVTEIVPAARTLLVRFQPDVVPAAEIAEWLRGQARRVPSESSRTEPGAPVQRVEIPVDYAGEDLDEVAQMLGLTRAQLIERHTGHDYVAAFAGFAPGFVYLTGGDPCFHGISRRAVPRTRVPAGSVAVAGGFSAVYPSDSPGGWRLLGVTPLRLWDLDRPVPALVRPGCRVRFRDRAAPGTHHSLPAAPRAAAGDGSAQTASGPAPSTSGTWFEVVDAGLQTLVQDRGRSGGASLGVAESGALDRASMTAANRLVGNPSGAAVLENAWGGLCLICHGRAVLAVVGAQVAVTLATASGVRLPAATEHRLTVEEGQVLRLGRPRAGMRSYVAVRGGWDVPPVLGSRATDVLSGIGPAPLRKGDRLAVGDAAAPGPEPASFGAVGGAERAGAADARLPRPGETLRLRVALGPRDDWFDAAALDRLAGQDWTVTPQSNRVGLRLAGAQPLTRILTGELPSEGMVAGAIQVPPSGQPVLFLADHPLTGGYPVIAVVADQDLDVLAQVPPGVRLRFDVAAGMALAHGKIHSARPS